MTDVKEVVSWQRRDQFTSVVQVRRHFDFLLWEKMLADYRDALGSNTNNNNSGV